MWGRKKNLEPLGKAGFKDIRIHQLEHDIQNDYHVIRKQQKRDVYTDRGFRCLRFHALESLTTLMEMLQIE
jgi:hypothetical protein